MQHKHDINSLVKKCPHARRVENEKKEHSQKVIACGAGKFGGLPSLGTCAACLANDVIETKAPYEVCKYQILLTEMDLPGRPCRGRRVTCTHPEGVGEWYECGCNRHKCKLYDPTLQSATEGLQSAVEV